MRPMPSAIAALLALAASAAVALSIQSEATQVRRVAPGSHWWINDGSCEIYGNWGSPETDVTTLWVASSGGGAYRIGMSNTLWRDIPQNATAQIGLGFDGGRPAIVEEAFGISNGDGGQGFELLAVGSALTDGMTASRELNIYRAGEVLESLELEGAGAAVAAMNACLAAQEAADSLANASMDDSMAMNMSEPLDDATMDALERAADAAEAAAHNAASTPDR